VNHFTAQVIRSTERDELLEAFYHLSNLLEERILGDRQNASVIKERIDRGGMRERENIDDHITLKLK